MDLEKVYDMVNKGVLWHVLKTYGKAGIRIFHDEGSACVHVSSTISNISGINVGVRQGCVMSPLLFNINMDICRRGDNKSQVQIWMKVVWSLALSSPADGTVHLTAQSCFLCSIFIFTHCKLYTHNTLLLVLQFFNTQKCPDYQRAFFL